MSDLRYRHTRLARLGDNTLLKGIAQGMYYSWSKDFLEAGKKRLAGDTARAATSDEVKHLKREAVSKSGGYLLAPPRLLR
jgi:hypothetical protein